MMSLPPRYGNVHAETVLGLFGDVLSLADLTPDADGLYDPLEALDLAKTRRRKAKARVQKAAKSAAGEVILDAGRLPDTLEIEGVMYLSTKRAAYEGGLQRDYLHTLARYGRHSSVVKVFARDRNGPSGLYWRADDLPKRPVRKPKKAVKP